MTTFPISILDRSHLHTGGTVATALLETIARAKHAERLGFSRFWVSEHHGVPGVAGASPAVLLAALGKETSTIRLGSGGVMVPNHQPLVIVEQFGTLDALFPNRIDLGLGRSLGFIRPVRRALRREAYDHDDFARDLSEITSYLLGTAEITSYPGTGANVQPFVLASAASAIIAAHAGLPLVAGGPGMLARDNDGATIFDRYRDAFRPSPFAAEPYVVLSLPALAADTEEAAADLALPEAWAFVDSKSQGAFLPLESPDAIKEKVLTERQRARLVHMTSDTITGTTGQIARQIEHLVITTGADEVMLTGSFHALDAALHSDSLIAESFALSNQAGARSTYS